MFTFNLNKIIETIKRDLFWQFAKFCLIGFFNTFVDFGVYLLFSRVIGLYFLYANIIATFTAMNVSFFANKYWTFNDRGKKLGSQYLKFALVNLIYILLNNTIVFTAVHFLGIYDLGAKVMAIAVGLVWNFFANRYWTFKRELSQLEAK